MSFRPTHFEPASVKQLGTALVMSADNRLIDQFSKTFKQIDVSIVSTSLVRDSMELIHGKKFEAFVLDTAIDTTHLDLLSEIRSSASNSNALVIAIAAPGPLCDRAREVGANFVLEQPLPAEIIHRTIRAAYGMIVRECRRYFRCPLKVNATVWSSVSGDMQGETVNLSEDGMALFLPYSLAVDTELLVRFKLPPHPKELVVRAKITRTQENRLAGLKFVEIPDVTRGLLHEWLSHRLEEKIPSLAKQSA